MECSTYLSQFPMELSQVFIRPGRALRIRPSTSLFFTAHHLPFADRLRSLAYFQLRETLIGIEKAKDRNQLHRT